MTRHETFPLPEQAARIGFAARRLACEGRRSEPAARTCRSTRSNLRSVPPLASQQMRQSILGVQFEKAPLPIRARCGIHRSRLWRPRATLVTLPSCAAHRFRIGSFVGHHKPRLAADLSTHGPMSRHSPRFCRPTPVAQSVLVLRPEWLREPCLVPPDGDHLIYRPTVETRTIIRPATLSQA